MIRHTMTDTLTEILDDDWDYLYVRSGKISAWASFIFVVAA